MPEYAKVVDGNVVEIGPEPDAFQVPDKNGDLQWVSTPADTDSPPALLRKAGYLPVEDDYEKEDPHGAPMQYGAPVLDVKATKVVRHFPLVPTAPAEPDPNAERITGLDQRLMQVEQLTSHYKPMIDDWSQAGPVNEMDARALYGAYMNLLSRVRQLEERLAGEG